MTLEELSKELKYYHIMEKIKKCISRLDMNDDTDIEIDKYLRWVIEMIEEAIK